LTNRRMSARGSAKGADAPGGIVLLGLFQAWM
jgi:hypothetical protein